MPPGGRSRKACGGGYAAEPPRPWPHGREQPPQREMKVGYLMAGAWPKGLLLPTPFRGHPRSPHQSLEPGSPAEVIREIMSTEEQKCWKSRKKQQQKGQRIKRFAIQYII